MQCRAIKNQKITQKMLDADLCFAVAFEVQELGAVSAVHSMRLHNHYVTGNVVYREISCYHNGYFLFLAAAVIVVSVLFVVDDQMNDTVDVLFGLSLGNVLYLARFHFRTYSLTHHAENISSDDPKYT